MCGNRGVNPFSLEERTVFITGASSGIGRATAAECAKMGATLVITGRNKERLNETLAALEGEGHTAFTADLSNTQEINDLVEKLPVLDGVVLNAGITASLTCQFITEDKLDSLMKVNTYAPILLSAALLRANKIAKGGSVVFTASLGGYLISSPGEAMYSASKAAVIGYARTMAIELGRKNIRVNTVCPGVIETAIFDSTVLTAEKVAEGAKQYPLRRYGKPCEVAWGIVYLLSGASSFVTGSNLVIDGGVSIK